MHSTAAKFRCLENVIQRRKASSTSISNRPARPMKPLKKSALANSLSFNEFSYTGPSAPSTPKKTRKLLDGQEVLASPNGSFVDGWLRIPPRFAPYTS